MPACLVHAVDYARGLALTARNLCLAEEEHLDLFTLCSSCFGNLSRAKYLLENDRGLRKEVNQILAEVGKEYKGEIEVKHVITVLHDDIAPSKLSAFVERPLSDLKVAAFYGCHMFLPHKYSKFDDPEFPHKLDRLIEVTGAESIDYENKTSCCIGCGSFFGGVSEEASTQLADQIVGSAKKRGVDCVVTTCPFCIMQLELGQLRIERSGGEPYRMPILHYVELLGLALGLTEKDLGLDLRRIDPTPLLEKVHR
jgi:heterodisulfide reductase subunit B